MSTYLLALFIGIGFVCFVGMVIYSVLNLKAEVPQEDREYLDPLPKGLRMVWPLVRFLDYQIGSRIPERMIARPAEMLRQTGLLYLMSGRQFISLCIFSAICFALISAFCISIVWEMNYLVVLGAAAFGFVYPNTWLRKSLINRRKLILKGLPAYLDFLTMGIEAGLNMAGSIQQAVMKGPAGPLKNEMGLVLRDLRSGLNRAEALQRMNERIGVAEVSNFVNAVVQAERMGASLGPTFRYQADQRRTERFQRAEKMAMEAPVKLIFPLVAFIFPITFLVLLFPIAMKYIESGGL